MSPIPPLSRRSLVFTWLCEEQSVFTQTLFCSFHGGSRGRSKSEEDELARLHAAEGNARLCRPNRNCYDDETDLVSQFLSSAWLELMSAPWKQWGNNSPPSQ